MNYDNYKFVAVIDWIDVEIETVRATNFFTLRRLIDDKYVEALNPTASNSATKFRIRIHDLKLWNSLHNLLNEIKEKYSFRKEAEISAIEVSIDGYSKRHSKQDLLELTEHYLRFLSRPVSQNIRFSGTDDKQTKQIESIDSAEQLQNLLKNGRNICIGNTKSKNNKWIKADDEYMQIYCKTTDNGMELKVENHRARIEVRLQGLALPVKSVRDFEKFGFQKLAKYFNMRTLDTNVLDKAPNSYMKVLNNVTMIGAEGKFNRRKYSPITKADSALNDKFYEALRNLTIRLQRNTKKTVIKKDECIETEVEAA